MRFKKTTVKKTSSNHGRKSLKAFSPVVLPVVVKILFYKDKQCKVIMNEPHYKALNHNQDHLLFLWYL